MHAEGQTSMHVIIFWFLQARNTYWYRQAKHDLNSCYKLHIKLFFIWRINQLSFLLF